VTMIDTSSRSRVEVRRIEVLEPDAVSLLLEESEMEGFRFVRRLVNEYASGANQFDAPGEALLGAYSLDLIGVCGLNRDPYLDDPSVGRVRRLYVSPRCRHRGVGRSLVGAVIREAGRQYRVLVLRSDAPEACAFYRALGFSAGPRLEHATHYLDLTEAERGLN